MAKSMTKCDPASKRPSSWVSRLGALKSRQVPDDDPRVIECREALAFHRVRHSIEVDAGELSRPGVDRLVAALRQAVAR